MLRNVKTRSCSLTGPAGDGYAFHRGETGYMRRPLKNNWIEWGFIVLLAGLCLMLTVLQYRWTGEVSRAEVDQLRSGIGDRAQQFCNAFDTALMKSCNILVPHNQPLNDQNRETVHAQRV